MVGRKAGCWHKTAKKYWEEASPYGDAIAEIVAREQATAAAERDAAKRAREEEEAQARRDQIRSDVEGQTRDSARVRTEEAKLIDLSRANVLDMLEATAALTGACNDLKDHIAEALLSDGVIDKAKKDPAQALALVREVGKVLKDGQEAARLVVQLERLVLGEPTETRRLVIETDEEADEELGDLLTILGSSPRAVAPAAEEAS